MTATCVWCNKTAKGETGSVDQCLAKNGMLYIHQACFAEMDSLPDECNLIIQMIKEGKDKYGNEDPIEFISRMQRHKRRWEGSMKLVASITKEPCSVNYGHEQEKENVRRLDIAMAEFNKVITPKVLEEAEELHKKLSRVSFEEMHREFTV